MILKNQYIMTVIKNIKYEIYQFAPIIIKCKSYSKLLDVSIKLSTTGLKLDVSYTEPNGICHKDTDLFEKRFHFSIKRTGEFLDDDGFVFLKMFDLLISDSVEKYYIFYKEECGEEETRTIRLNDLGI